jgi:hypothetical protein
MYLRSFTYYTHVHAFFKILIILYVYNINIFEKFALNLNKICFLTCSMMQSLRKRRDVTPILKTAVEAKIRNFQSNNTYVLLKNTYLTQMK